jgi:hypothetical protein
MAFLEVHASRGRRCRGGASEGKNERMAPTLIAVLVAALLVGVLIGCVGVGGVLLPPALVYLGASASTRSRRRALGPSCSAGWLGL